MQLYATPDQLIAAAGYVTDKFGCHGYRLSQTGWTRPNNVCTFEMLSADGGRRHLAVDAACNVRLLSDDSHQHAREVHAMTTPGWALNETSNTESKVA